MKTIYCIGDSFTQGTELADADHFGSTYPGYATFDNKDSLKRELNRQWWNKHAPDVNNSKILLDKENLRAWPEKLKRHLANIFVVNAGVQGKSMQYIADTLIKDLINKQYQVDLVIVQYTDPIRLEFSEGGSSFTLFLQNKSVHKNQEILRNALLNIETDESLYFRWLTQLTRIQDFCRAHNLPLLFVDSVNVDRHYKNQFESVAYLENYLQESVLAMIDVARSFSLQTEVLAAGGHFTEIVHDKFAAELSKIIQDRKLI